MEKWLQWLLFGVAFVVIGVIFFALSLILLLPQHGTVITWETEDITKPLGEITPTSQPSPYLSEVKKFESARGTPEFCEGMKPVYYPNGTQCDMIYESVYGGIGKIAVDKNYLYVPLDNGTIKVIRKGDWKVITTLSTKPNYVKCCEKYITSAEICSPTIGENCKWFPVIAPTVATDEKYVYAQGHGVTIVYSW